MRVFLDDERNPRVQQYDRIVRSFEDFVSLVLESFDKVEPITYISFDHDLGTEKTGYDCAKYLVEMDLNFGILSSSFDFNVHSANPVGAANIKSYLENYLNVARIHDLP